MNQTNDGKAVSPAELAYNRAMAEKDTETEKPDPLNDELQAMRSVARQLEKLDGDAQARVVAWLSSRYAQARFDLGIGRLNPR